MHAGREKKERSLAVDSYHVGNESVAACGERVSVSTVLYASLKCRRAGRSACHPSVSVDTRHDDVWVISWDEDDMDFRYITPT